MLKIEIKNAMVKDTGYGLEVNGKSLNTIISMALGTKAEGLSWNDPRKQKLKEFEENSCDVTVILKPHPTKICIEDDKNIFDSVEDLEEFVNERIGPEVTESET